jgi:hypothetical protein
MKSMILSFPESLFHKTRILYIYQRITKSDDNEYEAKLMPNAAFHPIESIWGHFAGRGINSADNQFIDDNLKRLLALSTNG